MTERLQRRFIHFLRRDEQEGRRYGRAVIFPSASISTSRPAAGMGDVVTFPPGQRTERESAGAGIAMTWTALFCDQ